MTRRAGSGVGHDSAGVHVGEAGRQNAVRVDQREVAGAPVRALTPTVVPARQAVLRTGPAGCQATLRAANTRRRGEGSATSAASVVREAAGGDQGQWREAAVGCAGATDRARDRAAGARVNRSGRGAGDAAGITANGPGQPQTGQPAPVAPAAGSKAVEPPNRPAGRAAARPVSPNNAAQPAQADRPVAPAAVHPNEIPAPPRPVVQPSANAKNWTGSTCRSRINCARSRRRNGESSSSGRSSNSFCSSACFCCNCCVCC